MTKPIRILGQLALVALLFTATLLTLLRLLLPQTVQYSPEFESLISNLIGRTVSFEDLSAKIQGFEPRLDLRNVTILDAQNKDSAIRFSELEIGFSISQSLLQWQLIPDKIIIVGPKLTILILPDQNFQVGGFLISMDNQANPPSKNLLNWLLAQEEIQIREAEINLQNFNLPEQNLKLSHLSLDIGKEERFRKITASSMVRGAILGHVNLTGYFNDLELDSIKRFTSRLHLKTTDLKINNFKFAGNLINGALDLDYWGSFFGTTLMKQAGEFALSDFSLSPYSPQDQLSPTFKAQRLSAGFNWTRAAKSWGLLFTDLDVQHALRKWSSPSLNAQFHRGNGALRIKASSLDIGDMLALAMPFSTAKNEYPLIKRGKAANLDFYYRGGNEKKIHADMDLLDVEIVEGGKFPGISGLNGSLSLRDQAGVLEIDSRQVQYSQKNLFREPLHTDQITGKIHWQLSEENARVFGEDLQIESQDLGARAYFELDLQKGRSPELFLIADILHADGEQTSRYLPAGIMSQKTVNWLDKGIIDANVSGGKVLLKGALKDFPFTNNDGRFRVEAKFDQGQLNYQSNSSWPTLDEIDGLLIFDGERMEILANSARTLDSKVLQASAVIAHLRQVKNSEGLVIAGELAGDLSDAVKFLNQSPLHKVLGPEVLGINARGNHHLTLDLRIPLTEGGNVKVKGRSLIVDGSIQLPQPDLKLEQVSSTVDFSESSIIFDQGMAKTLGGNTAFKIINESIGKERHTKIEAEGASNIQEAAALIGLPVEGIAKGTLSWKGSLDIANEWKFNVDTELGSIDLSFPAPLNKPDDNRLSLIISGNCLCSGSNPEVYLDLSSSNNLFAGIALSSSNKKWSIKAADLAFGKDSHLTEKAITLRGAMPVFNLDEWQDWLENRSIPSTAGQSLPVNFDLKIADFSSFDQHFVDIGVTGSLRQSEWFLDFDGKGLKGHLGLQEQNRVIKLLADFDVLDIVAFSDQAGSTINPADLPKLDIYIKNLTYNGRQIGELELNTSPQINGLVADKIKLSHGSSAWNGSGAWTSNQGIHESAMRVALETGDFSEVWQIIGLKPLISDAKGDALANVSWPGTPYQFSLNTLTGTLVADLSAGRIRSLEPGLGRLFGILSIERLEKRLFLDFSDILGRGLTFDKFKSSLKLDEGNAKLEKLSIHGPAARINMSGAINLLNHGIDLTVSSVPHVTSSLPLAATIASVGLGAAVYVGQQLLEKRIDDLTDRRYSITGTWDDPIVERIP